MITIVEAKTRKELKAFVKFPFGLYKGSKYWVPPIISEEVKTFTISENPVFKNAFANFFLVYRDNKAVGRFAAIINWIEVKEQNIKKMRFGWFDVIDDLDVTKAIVEKVTAIAKENNLEFIEGPVGFSNLDKVGVLTEGFDHIGTMITWYNHPYYATHLEALGFKPAKGYIESKFKFADIDPNNFTRLQELIKNRYELRSLKFTNNKDILNYADQMFEVFEKSHSKLSSFVAIDNEQKEYFKKKFMPFLNPEYTQFIVDKDDKLVAFAIVTPSFARALQKMNGKLYPFRFRHLLNAKKHSKTVTFYLIGVLPEYQNKGVTSIIFHEFYKVFDAKGITDCIRGPELEDNIAIHQLWKHFNPKIHRRRYTYRKEIE